VTANKICQCTYLVCCPFEQAAHSSNV